MSGATERGGAEQPDVDARFADIIARWDEASPTRAGQGADPAADQPTPAPEQEYAAPVASAAPDPAAAARTPPTAPGPQEPAAVGDAERPHRGEADDADEDDHFVPPPPAPLPAGDLQFWAILVGLVGGPLLLLYQMVFVRDGRSWWLLAAVAMMAAGFGLLVSRLPARRDEDDDDTGARV